MNEEEKEIIERIQQDSTFRERKLLRIIEKQQAEIEQLQKEAGYKKCILCGKIYKPNKKDQLYCSKSCCNKVMCKRYKLRKKQKIEKGE